MLLSCSHFRLFLFLFCLVVPAYALVHILGIVLAHVLVLVHVLAFVLVLGSFLGGFR